VLLRSSGGGATAAHYGTFGFSIIRPVTAGRPRTTISDRYEEAAALVLGAFSRLGLGAEIGEVRDEFCPGDHSIRVGSWEDGAKVVGIAQRVTRRATSVGGIVLVAGEQEQARVLERVYAAMRLPFRRESVGSLHRAGSEAGIEEAIDVFVAEASLRYAADPVPLDRRTLALARGSEHLHRA
jgi:lipoate-protein ligase A